MSKSESNAGDRASDPAVAEVGRGSRTLRFARPHHLPLRAAKAAVERLLDNEDLTIVVPKVEDAEPFESELAGLGIKTVRREAVEIAKQPDLARSC